MAATFPTVVVLMVLVVFVVVLCVGEYVSRSFQCSFFFGSSIAPDRIHAPRPADGPSGVTSDERAS